jgi:hypothetical protein
MALKGLTAEEKKHLLISVGTHRGKRALSPVEVAKLLRKAIESDTSLADCAAGVQLTTSQVSRFLSLLRIPSELHYLINFGQSAGTLGFSSAFELSRLDAEEDQRRAVRAVLELNLTSSEVRQLVQARERSRKSMDECVTTVLKMRPHVEVRHVFIGSVLKENIRERLHGLSQPQRDEILQGILKENFKELHATGRLGSERFTLVGGAELGAAVKTGNDQFEQEINAELRRSLSE